MQGERTGARARQEGGEADGGTKTVGRTVNGAARLAGQPVQIVVSAESRSDVSAQGSWKRGTVQGERTGARERQEGGEADGGTKTVGRTVNGAARLAVKISN